MALLLALLGLIAPLYGAHAQQALTITSIAPNRGTLAGGTKLTISGSGFADIMRNGNQVSVGPYRCTVITMQSAPETITCETSPGIAGTYGVTVTIGTATVTFPSYTYTTDRTPTLRAVEPRAGPPGQPIQIFGQATSSMQFQDCVATAWDEQNCVGSILVGDYSCRQDSADPDTSIRFNTYPRYGSNYYRVGCSVPDGSAPNSLVGAQSAGAKAGSSNVTLALEASMRGGQALAMQSSYSYDVNGTPYQFQLFPEVSSVSPSTGSNAGGTVLTITGRGFPDLSLGLGDTLDISVHGVPCKVLTSKYDQLTCITGPKYSSAPLSTVALKNQFAGMRGIEYEFYNRSVAFTGLGALNTAILAARKAVLYDIFAVPQDDFATSQYCSRFKTIFTAPRSGSYRFFMQADDYGRLLATLVQGSTTTTMQLINHTSFVGVDQWNQNAFQRSAPLALVKGQPVLLEAEHCNVAGNGQAQVGVQMPSDKPAGNSISEVQRIEVRANIRPRTVFLKYLYGAGASITSLKVDITGTDLKLDHPQLGLRLTIGSSALTAPVTVTVPVSSVAADIDDLIETALGGKFPSNDTLFGVRKNRGVNSVSLTFGANTASLPGFSIINPTLVVLPAAAAFTPSACVCSSQLTCSSSTSSNPSSSNVAFTVTGLTASAAATVASVGALNPTGNFVVATAVGGPQVTLPFTATASDVATAVRTVTNLAVSVTQTTWLEGPYMAKVWTVVFATSAVNNVPALGLVRDSSTPLAAVLASEVRTANPLLDGFFSISYNNECENVQIALSDTADVIRSKLSSLPSVRQPKSVEVTGSSTSGFNIVVTFDPFGNPGNVPPLRIAGISGLQGANPTATVVTVQDGSLDAFYGPIPAEFLSLPVEKAALRVVANGAPAACTHSTGLCAFTYADAATPTLSSVSPQSLSFESSASQPITINGNGLTGATVTVGGAPCTIVSSSATRIVCNVPDTVPAGVQALVVDVPGQGFAAGAFSLTLRTLFITGLPAVPSAALSGYTLLNLTGKGFDPKTCGSYAVTIGGVACGVAACGSDFITALFPGAASGAAAAALTAKVLGSNGAEVYSHTPAGLTMNIAASAAAVTAITSPTVMPSSGGSVTVTLGGAASPAGVAGMFLVPAITALSNFTAVSRSLRSQRVPCLGVTAVGASGVSCTAPNLPNGEYHVLAVLSSGVQVMSAGTITFDMVITSVTPPEGSVGGGLTLTIQGDGFSTVKEMDVVFLSVPASTTFLNGLIPCDVKTVSQTEITCVTRPHLAAEADSYDPLATNVMPVPTSAGSVQLVICPSSYNASVTMQEYCWSLPNATRARCAGACTFSYSADLTPSILGVAPVVGAGGTTVTVSGQNLAAVTAITFRQGGVIKGSCDVSSAGAESVSCTAPSLLAGVYNLVLVQGSGEMSVDALNQGVFTYVPTIVALAGNAGSVAGGLPLAITAGGAGFATGPDNATANQVFLGGLACPIISVDSATQLTCRAPPLAGRILAEYWRLSANTFSLPDLSSYTKPEVTRFEDSLAFNWGLGSPDPVLGTDFWAARFTFHWQNTAAEPATFRLDCDDSARLFIDDRLIGGCSTPLSVTLTPGHHVFVVHYVEYTGSASVALRYQPNPAVSMTALPWSKITAMQPGRALPVQLRVNGVAAVPSCPAQSLSLSGPTPATSETANFNFLANTCQYVYSSYRTPALVPQASSQNGINAVFTPTMTSVGIITIWGTFNLEDSAPPASQIKVEIGGQECALVSASSSQINCTMPALPAGTYDVAVFVNGWGYTRAPITFSNALPKVTYAIAAGSPLFNSPTSQVCTSLWGGGVVNITASGLVRGVNSGDLKLDWEWDASSCTGAQCTSVSGKAITNAAISDGRFKPTVLACNGPTMLVQFPRYAVSSVSGYAGNAASSLAFRFRPRINTASGALVPSQWFSSPVTFCGGRTPVITSVSPASGALSPNAGGTLRFTWTIQESTMSAVSLGSASRMRVDLQAGSTGASFACANPTVTASSVASSTYTETLSCTLPDNLPAADYTLWGCLDPWGCGQLPAYSVPLTVTGISPSSGGSGGGSSITITGSGFDKNATRVSVFFDGVPCKVTASTGTTVTCTTGQLPVKPTSTRTISVTVQPTSGAANVTTPGVAFSFDPALEATVTAVSPARGSTAGGTTLTISGSFSATAATTVTIGDLPCINVIATATSVTCTTTAPAEDAKRVPMPVSVLQQGLGAARSSVSYQYVDLWSSRTTWGGGSVPTFDSLVNIPAGLTVLLDVSPPKLLGLVLEGTLIFDDSQSSLELQSNWILVAGGNLTVGTAAKPWPAGSVAKITMHGTPFSKELPLYGTKTLAVREGSVTMFGQAKMPHYTTLAATALQNDTTISINGAVNWQVGDVIVIASSSFRPSDVDEATITAIDATSTPDVTRLTLNKPLQWTHLGVIHTQAGAQPLDMRAEVAVLTRNVVLQGDADSAKYQYGIKVMVSTPKSAARRATSQLDNVEVAQSGQAFRFGHDSIKWHLQGDMAMQSWVRGCSIHNAYSRAVTIHGTNRALVQQNVAYNVMGHTFFLESGSETGNVIENNLAIYTRVSDAMLVTDYTPASYWVSNPNNTIRHNRASGSEAYGFWYRLEDSPSGPSATSTVCPKFTPLGEFSNNTAHSNVYEGLRIHPEYYPRNVPCQGLRAPFAQVPAVFNMLTAYKNGMKGFSCTSCGLVQVTNAVLGDNGAGPLQRFVYGKEQGGNWEMAFVMDDRNRYDVPVSLMAGLTNATLYAKTSSGDVGTAGWWPSDRRIAGAVTQSPVQGPVALSSKQSALMSLVNVAFVGYSAGSQFVALEACGKCRAFQGGATTTTSKLAFLQTGLPALTRWSWGHQGVYQDMDGTLINSNTVPATALAAVTANGWAVGPNTTWHSRINNTLLGDTKDCVAVPSGSISNAGTFCNPALTFRRVMLNRVAPSALLGKEMYVVSVATNRSSIVRFSPHNENGYMFTVAAKRDYWVHWDISPRVDPESYTLHKMDLLSSSQDGYISTRHMQVMDYFEVNRALSTLTAMPPLADTTPHGAFFYNKAMASNSWWWGKKTYSDTKFSVHMAGNRDTPLTVVATSDCPVIGCDYLPVEPELEGYQLQWAEFVGLVLEASEVTEGRNITIPYGVTVTLDSSPPALNRLVIQGELVFSPDVDVTLAARHIVVMDRGVLRAGSPSEPHPSQVRIELTGTRNMPDWVVSKRLNLGSKGLSAVRGGRIELYGKQVTKRWVRLAAPAMPGDKNITLSDAEHGWSVGDKIVIAATSFNTWQTEMRTLTDVSQGGRMLLFNEPLLYPHGARVKAYPGGPTVDMRAEVGMISSNIVITASDEATRFSSTGEKFGARVLINGESTGRFDNIALTFCGQAGLESRACINFDTLSPVAGFDSFGNEVAVPNPSFLRNSALVWGMNSNVRISTSIGVASPVEVSGNVMYESYDTSGILVLTGDNKITNNLAMGTIKDALNKRAMDSNKLAGTFEIAMPNNWVEGNVAAGSDRYGFIYSGLPCRNSGMGSFANNTAHGNLAGMWLRSSSASRAAACTGLSNFTTYMNWDFGIITTRGIETDVIFTNVNVLDTKHAGVMLLRAGKLTDMANLEWRGGLLVGQSDKEVCSACAKLADPGCHKQFARFSFNKEEPFTPSMGIKSAVFALNFSPGLEGYPWDLPWNYAMVHGKFNISGVTIADFLGPAGCGAGTYALGNHPDAPDAFHPHYFSQMNVVNVATGSGQGMFLHTGPNPIWRNEADCGTDTIARPSDGSAMEINCAGPAHAYWRDLDGTLLASGDGAGQGTIAGVFASERRFPEDQGSPVLPGACTYSSVYDSYRCAVNSSSFLLDPRLKPQPQPPRGIWGDPQLFVLESRDPDTETRNFGPVAFNVSGSVDYVASANDYGWCFNQACQKRLSSFWTYLPAGQTVHVSFRSTPASAFRLWFPYADSSAELVIVINYQSSPLRRFVWLPAGAGQVEGRLMPQAKPPTIGDGTGHGAFFWDLDSSLLTVKLRGGRSMEVRTEQAVLVSQSLAMSIDTFYNTKPLLMANIAKVMSTTNLFIANVVPGSITVEFAVAQDWNTSNAVMPEYEPEDTVGLDSATQAELKTRITAAAAARGGSSSSKVLQPDFTDSESKSIIDTWQRAAIEQWKAMDTIDEDEERPTKAIITGPSAKEVADSITDNLSKLLKLLSSPTAEKQLGVPLLGEASVSLQAITDPALLEQLTSSLPPASSNPGTPTTPGATPGPSGSNPPGSAAPTTQSPGPSPPSDSGDKNGAPSSSRSNKAVIGGVVGALAGCALLGMVTVAAVVARRKQAQKRTAEQAIGGDVSSAAGAFMVAPKKLAGDKSPQRVGIASSIASISTKGNLITADPTCGSPREDGLPAGLDIEVPADPNGASTPVVPLQQDAFNHRGLPISPPLAQQPRAFSRSVSGANTPRTSTFGGSGLPVPVVFKPTKVCPSPNAAPASPMDPRIQALRTASPPQRQSAPGTAQNGLGRSASLQSMSPGSPYAGAAGGDSVTGQRVSSAGWQRVDAPGSPGSQPPSPSRAALDSRTMNRARTMDGNHKNAVVVEEEME